MWLYSASIFVAYGVAILLLGLSIRQDRKRNEERFIALAQVKRSPLESVGM